MRRSLTTIATVMLALTIIAWCGVVYEQNALAAATTAQAQTIQQSALKSASADYRARLAVLASATTKERAEIDASVPTDVVAVAKAIEAVGERVNTSVQVSDATAEGGALDIPGMKLQAVSFAIQADGTFTNLMSAASLIEELPLPLSIEDASFQKTDISKSKPWHLSMRVRVLTSFIAAQ